MPGLILDQRAAVYRMQSTGSGNRKAETVVYESIQCAIVPISSFYQAEAYQMTTTHILWVPHWVVLEMEDKIRRGRRKAGATIVQLQYTVNGVREVTQGIRQRAYYLREGQ